ncbi:unnamed protein product [Fusarium graminearum]|uniref:Uncharacterized protein n=1 Tax=Gibberella zeae TaxID=5518 RepID=A0A4E9DNL4_GIBZA|nr:unnamed protein product [Fusarium graminearum]CAF3602808.1 unnamed protein product [Fusarium graminearum]CAG1964386.1 unnamed protein product [Fusarium graminearum]CAG1969472.1 unnamed protein product [Fusarium graminearum]
MIYHDALEQVIIISIMSARESSNFNQDSAFQLAVSLWSWSICQGCTEKKRAQCGDHSCPGGRIAKVQRYLQYYEAVVSIYLDATPASTRDVSTYSDILSIISILKSHPDAPLSEIRQLASPNTNAQTIHSSSHADAVALGVKAMLMIDPSPLYHSTDRLENGTFRVHWKEDVPLSKYIQDSFPLGNHNILSYVNSELFTDAKRQLKAVNLKRRLNITIRATSDIRNHLRFDRRNRVLDIYHYTSFLKEQLRVTKDVGDCSTPSLSLKRGVLPRQLVLEILDSLQGTLFPLSDAKSKKLVRSLITKCNFDPDILNFEFSSVRRVGEESVPIRNLAVGIND